jgi:hypothetical protein
MKMYFLQLPERMPVAVLFDMCQRTQFCRFWLPFWARSQNFEKRLFATSCLSFRPSVRSHSASTGQIFIEFHSYVFFENLSIKFEFH